MTPILTQMAHLRKNRRHGSSSAEMNTGFQNAAKDFELYPISPGHLGFDRVPFGSGLDF